VSSELRDRARRALATSGVTRGSFEVRVDGASELVTFSLSEDGTLRVMASDGRREGPFVEAALGLLARAPAEEEPAVRARASMPPKPRSPYAGLADALDELLTAVCRLGADDAYLAPGVEEAVEQVLRTAPQPTPLGLARVIGRLRTELAVKNLEGLARVLEGTSRLAAHLRSEHQSGDDRRRISAWLDAPGQRRDAVQTVYDRDLLEVGRQWVAGLHRGSIQRRYLMCLATGRVYCEERRRADPASVGPSPRRVLAGLSEVESSVPPHRIRLLQYEVSPVIASQHIQDAGELAVADFSRLLETYRASLRAYPALAEPFVVLRARLHAGGRILRDEEDRALPLGGHQEVLRRFCELTGERTPLWVAGLLCDDDGALKLAPFSAAFPDGDDFVIERLR